MNDLDDFLNSLKPMDDAKGHIISLEETRKRYEKSNSLQSKEREDILAYQKEQAVPPPFKGRSIRVICVDKEGIVYHDTRVTFNGSLYYRVIDKNKSNMWDDPTSMSIATKEFFYDPRATFRCRKALKELGLHIYHDVYVFVSEES